jgi:hypothetical protein
MVGRLEGSGLILGQFLPYFSGGLRIIGPTLRATSHAIAHPQAHIQGVTQTWTRGKPTTVICAGKGTVLCEKDVTVVLGIVSGPPWISLFH